MIPSWQDYLRQNLNQHRPARLALLGIGSQQRGDDAVGGLIARRLLPHADAQFGVFVADHAPENCLGRICRFAPDVLLVVDAMRMGRTPGTVQFVSAEQMDGWSGSTHTLPLPVLVQYMTAVSETVVFCLGIEPAQLAWESPLSVPVAAAADAVCAGLLAARRQAVTFITPIPA